MTKFNENAKLESGTILVATYGSLRRGMSNFGVNARGNGVFGATGLSTVKIPLYQYGGGYFPSISLNPEHVVLGTSKVVVDIFLSDEQGLTGAYDSLEGYNHRDPENGFYNRTEVEFELTSDLEVDGTTVSAGTVVTAWVYHIDEVQPNPVFHGDWCIFKRGEDHYERLAQG